VTSCSLGGGGQSVHEVGKDSDVVTVGVLVHEDTHMCTAVVIVVDSETASREREPRATYPHSCCFRISKDSPPPILLLLLLPLLLLIFALSRWCMTRGVSKVVGTYHSCCIIGCNNGHSEPFVPDFPQTRLDGDLAHSFCLVPGRPTSFSSFGKV
jgi:hypothetical protein